jgi:hypothetical protein
VTTPKSGKVRAVPLAPDVASALAQLGRRANWIGEDDLVFASEVGTHLDGSALRRRYKAALDRAALRSLRFHDLRHTFGTRMIAKADIRRVQEWMGHADIRTTMRYLHYAPHAEDARLVAEAFAVTPAPDVVGRVGTSEDVSQNVPARPLRRSASPRMLSFISRSSPLSRGARRRSGAASGSPEPAACLQGGDVSGRLSSSTWCVQCVSLGRGRATVRRPSAAASDQAQHVVSRGNSIKHGREIDSVVSARVRLDVPRRRASGRALCFSRTDARI